MKLLSLVLLSALATSVSQAQTLPDPATQLQPVRMAKAHISITKYTWTTTPNPSVKQDPVCEKELEVPVFDARGVQGSWFYNLASTDCESTVDAKKVNVWLNAAMLLSDKSDPVDHTARKYFHSNMNVGYPVQGASEQIPALATGMSAWSHDITLHSLGLDLEPALQWVCVAPPNSGNNQPFPDPKAKTLSKKMIFNANQPAFTCSPSLDEWFVSNVEFED